MQLPEKILALRKARNMSQEDLATALRVTRQTVSRWEVGSALPDAENLLQLSLLFDVPADYLLRDGEMGAVPVSAGSAGPASELVFHQLPDPEPSKPEAIPVGRFASGRFSRIIATIFAVFALALVVLAWYMMEIGPALAALGFAAVAVGFVIKGEQADKKGR